MEKIVVFFLAIACTRAHEYFYKLPVNSSFEGYTSRITVKFLVLLNNTPSGEGGEIIQIITRENPLLENKPDLAMDFVEEIVIPGASDSSKLFLSLECINRQAPFSIHPNVERLMTKYLSNLNDNLVKHRKEIIVPARQIDFYVTNKQYLNCIRRKFTLEWEVQVPIRELGSWENYKLIPIPFKLRNVVCEWQAGVVYLAKNLIDSNNLRERKEVLYSVNQEDCKTESVCHLRVVNPRQPESLCIRTGRECRMHCPLRSETIYQKIDNNTVLIASTEKITIQCPNNTETIDNDKDGGSLIKTPEFCNIPEINFKSGEQGNETLSVTKYPIPRELIMPVSSSASATIISTNRIYKPWTGYKPTRYSQGERQIWDKIDHLSNLISGQIIITITFVLIPIVLYVFYRNMAIIGAMCQLVNQGRAIDVQVGPRQFYPDYPIRTWDETYPNVIVLSLCLAILVALIILACKILRR